MKRNYIINLKNIMNLPLVNYLISIFSGAYRWIVDNLIHPSLFLLKGLEYIVFILSILFFLTIVIIIIRNRYNNIPRSYKLEILDEKNKKVKINGLRRVFARKDVAESYARFYSENFIQYEFKVIGSKRKYQLEKKRSISKEYNN